jgi:hypothetical protein
MRRFTSDITIFGCFFDGDEGGGAGGGAGSPAPGAAAEGAAGSGDGGTKPDGKTYDEKYVKSIRDEAAKARTELRTAAAELKKLQDAQLSDSEKLQARVKELEENTSKAEARARLAEAKAAAAEAGAQNATAVAKLLEPDEDIDKGVARIKKEVPALFTKQTGSADGGAGGGTPRTGPSMNDFIRRSAGRI